MPMDALKQLLFNKCANHPMADVFILSAIVEVESSWKPGLMRFEPNFIYVTQPEKFALRNGINVVTERALQRFSYGLGQLMGGTCRGLEFEGMLPELLEPSLNLDYMIKYYERNCAEYEYVTDKIAAYNSGSVRRLANGTYSNQGYVDKVLGVLSQDPTWTKAQGAVASISRPN